MYFSPSFLLLAITTLLTPSFAQSTNSSNDVHCLKFPPTIIGNATFNPAAIDGLSTSIAKNNFNPPLPTGGVKISPGGSTRIGNSADGGYQVCLQNFYFFKTLTVALSDISDVVKEIEQTCCGTTDNPANEPGRRGKCQDSKGTVKATDGSTIKVVGQDYGDRCCGMWGC